MVILNTHYNPHTAHVRSSLDAFLPLAVRWMERSLHGPGSIKSQSHHTTLAIELTVIKFNGLFNYIFLLRCNPTVSKHLMSIKLGMVTYHGVIKREKICDQR